MKKLALILVGACLLFLGCENVITSSPFMTQKAVLATQSASATQSKASFVPPGIAMLTARRAGEFFGAPTLGGARTIYADALAARLDSGEKLFILDVRDAASYAAKHIPGAVNIPLAVLFQPENLAKIPTDGTPVVAVCVTGHTASMAMSGLGILGYNAYVLRFGMMGWNASTAMKIWSSGETPQTIIGLGAPTDTTSSATDWHSTKALDIPPGIFKHIAANAGEFFGAPTLGGARTIYADALAARLDSGEKLFILDVRDAASYAAKHIPGAVNIPLAVLFQPENLAKIPTDGTPVVAVCVTGHTASMAMSGLGVLGYNAYVLRFGMMGWSASTAMKIWSSGETPQTIIGLGGPTNSGPTP